MAQGRVLSPIWCRTEFVFNFIEIKKNEYCKIKLIIVAVTTSLTAGLAGFAIYFVRSSSQNLIVACIYSLAITTANFVVGSIVVDIFPTHVGAVAICMMTCFGRIGAIASNLAFGMLLDISCQVPIFLVGAIVVCEYNKRKN